MKFDKTLHRLTRLFGDGRKGRTEKIIKATAAAGAAVWVVLQLRRELYGPGGTKLSRYDRKVDRIWDEKKEEAKQD